MNKIGGFSNYLISTILFCVFAFGFIMFFNQTAMDNDSRNIIKDDPALSNLSTRLNSSLINISVTSKSQLNATANDPVSVGFGSLIMYSIVGVGRIFTGTITTIYFSVFSLLINTLGIPPVVIGAFTGIVLIIIIFGIWRFVRIGS